MIYLSLDYSSCMWCFQTSIQRGSFWSSEPWCRYKLGKMLLNRWSISHSWDFPLLFQIVRAICKVVKSVRFHTDPRVLETFLSLKIKEIITEEQRKKTLTHKERMKQMSRKERRVWTSSVLLILFWVTSNKTQRLISTINWTLFCIIS